MTTIKVHELLLLLLLLINYTLQYVSHRICEYYYNSLIKLCLCMNTNPAHNCLASWTYEDDRLSARCTKPLNIFKGIFNVADGYTWPKSANVFGSFADGRHQKLLKGTRYWSRCMYIENTWSNTSREHTSVAFRSEQPSLPFIYLFSNA